MTNPYDRAEQRPASRLDPDPLYVPDDPTFDKPVIAVGVGFWVLAAGLITLAAFAIVALFLVPPARAASLEGDSWPRDLTMISTTGVIANGSKVELPDTATAVRGTATWYCSTRSVCTRGYPASGYFAAAGSEIRAWRGRLVRVRNVANGRSVVVRLVDVCGCPGSRVVDLYRSAFSRISNPSRGVIRVTVELERALLVPPTSTK